MPRSIRLPRIPALGFLLLFLLSIAVSAQAADDQARKIPFGAETELQGVIVERSADTLTVLNQTLGESRVVVTPSTRISEKKKNPFRESREYSKKQLLLGLKVDVSGHGDKDGALVAEEIRFTQNDLETARTIESRVTPLESDLEETRRSLEGTKTRLSATEEKLEMSVQKVQGDIEELEGAYRSVRTEAEAAKENSLKALLEVEYLDHRLDSLDDYQEVESLQVPFSFNSAELSPDSRPELDQLVERYKAKKGCLFQVVGFASADGNNEYNRHLSQSRAAAVVAYLTENGAIPLRRIISPYGFGEKNPIADNDTLEGRRQNRRVEVKVLMNQGLSDSKGESASAGSQ